jgi:demethylmenaquinone methyltransferase/2-methoxy-6-polyprenyl-1,4-benzoquinol methylase
MTNHVAGPKRTKPLYDIFTDVPRRYDLVNHVITLGFDWRWRRQAARVCLDSSPDNVLDLCCGTGDLVMNIAGMADGDLKLTGVDYSQPMLDIAAAKARQLTEGRKISFVDGEAADLPFDNGSFDCIGISFAFRNLTYKNPLAQSHLAEIFRVLRDGGRFVIIETSQPKSWLLRNLFHIYLGYFASPVGGLLSGNGQAYRYLAESATRFYNPTELKELLLTAGFCQVGYRPLLMGAVAINVAVK